MKLTLGFSPCPNDTFIFDALIHGKIDTEGLTFEVTFDDVETLNKKAFDGELDVTKLSYHAYAYITDKYVLLDSGSALGFGVGPMLIYKPPIQRFFKDSDQTDFIGKLGAGTAYSLTNPDLKVGIPGKYTTANFLLSLFFPAWKNKQVMVFSDIERELLADKIDFGLIIHENRFTYQDKGLAKLADLGSLWEEKTGCAIPLGGIVANRKLPIDVLRKLNRVLRRSVEFAFANPKSGLDFIRQHAQEMEESVMYKHIELYVNKYSIDLGDEGRKAIDTMFAMALEKGIMPEIKNELYVR
jgi:1,4-dihydroxy-6-naphthoate synthase